VCVYVCVRACVRVCACACGRICWTVLSACVYMLPELEVGGDALTRLPLTHPHLCQAALRW
jgi:hypothetical protein